MNTENTQAIQEYSQTEAALAELRQQYAGVQFDVATTKGDKAAREARQMLVKLRTGLEAKRKEIKAPALAYAKAIDTEAARITAAIRELEEPIDFQIRAEEARKAAEKAEKERLERQRVAEIKGRMDAIRNLPVDSTGDSAEQLAATLADLKAFEVTQADFAEFTEDATVARGYAIEQLERMHGHAVAREEEAARQAAAAAELERQRQEQEEREAQERAAQQEAQRKLDAERAEFERQKAEFEAQQRAAAEEAQRKADAEAQALVAKADVTAVVVAVAEEQRSMVVEPSGSTCPTCNDNGMIGGPSFYAPDEGGEPCPDCQQSATAAPAPGSYAACPRHNWLLEEGQDGNQPCPECAFDAASPLRAQEAPAQEGSRAIPILMRINGDVSTATLLALHAVDANGSFDVAVERHADWFRSTFGEDVAFEFKQSGFRVYASSDIREAFMAGRVYNNTFIKAEELEKSADAYVASLEG